MNNIDLATAAYHLILQRAPDDAGLRNWVEFLDSNQSPQTMVSAFMQSEEYRQKFAAPLVTEVVVGPHRLRMASTSDDVAIGASIQRAGTHEPWLTQHFLESLRTGQCVVDIGANIGWFALIAAAHVGASGRVHAFEPAPSNVQICLASAHMNGFNHLVCHPIALSDAYQVLRVHMAAGSNATVAKDVLGVENLCQSIPAIDALSPLGKIDVFKIDIEGYEPLVLRSAHSLLRQQRPTMFIEYHPWCVSHHGLSMDEFHELVFSLDMPVWVVAHDATTQKVVNATELIDAHRDFNRALGRNGEAHLDLMLTPS